ncbi:MAG TPA: Zn-dependent alcohol dehydrogenase [Vicinamibacterales bacterium]|nr:Zn-dependent alcohol dehydrogenase [Vicinamibacterales bacterium]
MRIQAAVVREQGKALTIETLDLAPPGAGEVLVEVRAAGVCHSDLHATSGDWPMKTPLVPGHEGAGVVREVGDGVTRVRRGDHVVFCWAPACGQCPPCTEGTPLLCDRLDKTTFRNKLPWGGSRLSAGGEEVAPFLGTACFATHTVVPEEGLVAVPAAVPFSALGAVGCAVVTGVGAVTNAAKLPHGAIVAVIGAGGVGVNVIQGAVMAGASRIIAVDREAGPLDLAQQLGATHVVQASGKTADAVKELTEGRGAEFVFDTVGSPVTLTDAVLSARKGGTVVITGLSRLDAQGALRLYPFVMHEKRLIGSVYGSGDPLYDIERLVKLHQDGRLKLDELTTRRYRLDEVNDALAALSRGEGGRGVIFPE